jgi:hypothetical protein
MPCLYVAHAECLGEAGSAAIEVPLGPPLCGNFAPILAVLQSQSGASFRRIVPSVCRIGTANPKPAFSAAGPMRSGSERREMKMTARITSAIFAGVLLISPTLALSQERQGEHTMQGEITSINKETGEVSINTQPVPVEVHFPADAIADLNEGDTITVHLSFEKQE